MDYSLLSSATSSCAIFRTVPDRAGHVCRNAAVLRMVGRKSTRKSFFELRDSGAVRIWKLRKFYQLKCKLTVLFNFLPMILKLSHRFLYRRRPQRIPLASAQGWA